MTAGSFEDGRPDVPGGLAGTAERVLVVGAGIAGLTVANALAHVGVECVVLEARDRIGGRLHTVDRSAGLTWRSRPTSGLTRRSWLTCGPASPDASRPTCGPHPAPAAGMRAGP